MRLLHVVPTYLPAVRYGGPIVSVHGLCRALAARGHDVHVFTTNVDGPEVLPVALERPTDVDGVKVWYFATGLGRRLYRSPGMGTALKQHAASFDVLHNHSVFLWPTTVAACVARRLGVPYVVSPRGMLVTDLIRRRRSWLKTAWIKAFERQNIACAAAVHATAEIEAEELERLGLTTRRVDVIPNGVDLPNDATVLTTPTQVKARPRVLSLGRISWKKGLDRLIRAMAFVPNAELVIAGNDEENYQPKLECLAMDCGVDDRVSFVGPKFGAAKWELIRSCDVFAMASYSENFGIAALEAMACGRAVVVTQEVGLAKAVSGSRAGLVASGDPIAFASALCTLIDDRDLRTSMGNRGAKLASETYSWAAIAAQMERVYEELKQSRSTTARST